VALFLDRAFDDHFHPPVLVALRVGGREFSGVFSISSITQESWVLPGLTFGFLAESKKSL
jgi:hypothetical protein